MYFCLGIVPILFMAVSQKKEVVACRGEPLNLD
jgi:hypothetical protein